MIHRQPEERVYSCEVVSKLCGREQLLLLIAESAQDWVIDHKKQDIQPVFANPSRSVVRQMSNAGLPKIIGEPFIAVRMHDAVRLCQVTVH